MAHRSSSTRPPADAADHGVPDRTVDPFDRAVPSLAGFDPQGGPAPRGPIDWRERLDRLAAGRGPWSAGRAAAAATAVLLAVAIGWWLLRPPAGPVEASIPLATGATSASGGGAGSPGPGGAAPAGAAAATSTTVATELVVQAAGAVARPGVFRLPVDARVDDLVREAGGLTAEADADRVNLAAPLADGERVWVPRQGEEQPPDVVAGTGGGTAPGSGGPSSAAGGAGGSAVPEVVDLNAATAEQLDTLPGVGPATATAILAYRDENGPFGSVDELLEVRGIGDAKLEQLRPLVRVG